jgi:hypothetical protein
MMVPLARILLEYGADPDARDKRGIPVHASATAPEVRAVLDEHRRAKRDTNTARHEGGPAKRKPPRRKPSI